MECKPRSKGRGRGRGVLALTSYDPCPRPSVAVIGQWHQPKTASASVTPQIGKQANKSLSSVQCAVPIKSSQSNKDNGCNKDDSNIRENGHQNGGPNFNNKDIRDIRVNSSNNSETNGFTNSQDVQKRIESAINSDYGMIAKYKYKANPNRPGGFDELNLVAGEKLKLIRKGIGGNDGWWEVKNEQGEQGFVPAKWCMVLEKTPTALPWLENKRLLEEKEVKKREAELAASGGSAFGAPPGGAPRIKEYVSAYGATPPVKGYVSAYASNGPPARTSVEASKQYYCDICDKNLNGPQPYKMHMSSKAHREEVEYQASKNN